MSFICCYGERRYCKIYLTASRTPLNATHTPSICCSYIRQQTDAGGVRKNVQLMGESRVLEWTFGAMLKGVYSEVEVLGSSNKGGFPNSPKRHLSEIASDFIPR